MNRAFPNGPLTKDLHPHVSAIWYSKHKEPDECEPVMPFFDTNGDAWEDASRRQLSELVDYLLGGSRFLTRREAFVIRMRFFEEMTMREIGELLEVTPDRIRQIEGKALRKLKDPYRYRAPLNRTRDAQMSAAKLRWFAGSACMNLKVETEAA